MVKQTGVRLALSNASELVVPDERVGRVVRSVLVMFVDCGLLISVGYCGAGGLSGGGGVDGGDGRRRCTTRW